MKTKNNLNRRKFFGMSLLAAGGLITSARAQSSCELKSTPEQPEGPFYPILDQSDKDTDLTSVIGLKGKAIGKVIIVQGKVQDLDCQPVESALVEIWQACHTGKYNHTSDPNPAPADPNFQYWGRAVTDKLGFYQFKTIVPGAYPAGGNWIRPPHIHFKIQKLGYIELITQMYFLGESLNDQDLILNRLQPIARQNVIVPLIKSDETEYPIANFNISLEKI